MSSVPKPKGVQPRTGKGVQPRTSSVMRLATPEMIAAMKAPDPSGQLAFAPQPFHGTPPPIAKAKTDPLSMPRVGSASAEPRPKGPLVSMAVSEPSAPIAKRKSLRMVKDTPDYRPLHREVPLEQLEDIKRVMGKRDDDTSVAADYIDAQKAIEGKNPYLTDTVLYTPQSRRSFHRFIQNNYQEVFHLKPEVKGKVDENACAALEGKAGEEVEAFLYQKFIREYIRNAGPYRGVLVYHGLGSGKTCSAIAAAEALYGTSNKKIIVMTPFSLRANFMSEISFCGFRHFNIHNHWVREPLISEGGVSYLYATSVLSLRPDYLLRVLRRGDEERKTIWIPDFTQPPNYDSEELSQQDREDIRAQLTEMIDSRIKFISYNGITAAKLKEYACMIDPVTGKREFDDAIIVIDEIHNLTRLMQDNIVPYIQKRKGRARRIEVEPIVPGRWVPGLCNKQLNYGRAYLFYRLLTDARNSKIIGLSGTPIINFPEELGILANVLAGYIECVEFTLLSADKSVMDKCREIAEAEPRIDIVRFRAGDRKLGVLLSVFTEGYEKEIDPEHPTQFIGVKFNAEAQEGIRDIFPRIKAKMVAAQLPIGSETYVSYPRLPIDDETFRREFINPDGSSIANKLVLQKRLTGLISYYKGSKEEYMPRVVKDHVETCDMSEHVLAAYSVARIREIRGEMTKEKEKGDVFAAVEVYAKMKNPSSYRFRSRAICNFAFPKSIERPFPDSKKEEEEAEEEVVDTDIAVAEMEFDAGVDVDALQQVVEEEAMVVNPEEVQVDAAEAEAEAVAVAEAQAHVAQVEAEVKKGGARPRIASISAAEAVAASQSSAPPSAAPPSAPVSDPVEEAAPASQPSASASAEPVSSAVAAVSDAVAPTIASIKESVSGAVESDAVAPTIASIKESVSGAVESVSGAVESAVKRIRKKPTIASEDVKPVVQVAEAAVVDAEADAVVAEALADAVEVEESRSQRILSYKESVKRAMNKLDRERMQFLQLDTMNPSARLHTYSPKLDRMIRHINSSKGSNLVYSQFKTVEGLGVLGIALKANGYVEIEISDSANPTFSDKTEASFRKGPAAKEKRFITFTGEGSKEHRALVLNLFNGNLSKLPMNMRTVLEESGYNERFNQYGEICWVIGITGAGAEGISLKCCRSVHIMEPYWNNVRLDQVKGRAIRICSHKDLPFSEREVEIYTYYTVFSEEQKRGDKIDVTIRDADKDRTTGRIMTSDENVYYVGLRKDKINHELLTIMKESAVDCNLNAADNDGVQCMNLYGKPDQYIFDPNLEVDTIITSIDFKEDDQKEVEVDKVMEKVAKELGTSIRTSSKVVSVPVCTFQGKKYLLQPKKGAGGLAFHMYRDEDTDFRNVVGEVGVNPATGTFIGAVPKIF